MNIKNYNEDRRLDILVLGPMSGKEKQNSSSAIIEQALKRIMSQPRALELLSISRITDYKIHIPEGWDEAEIVNGVLSRLDIADLVIVNITSKDGPTAVPSPNVFYELGLVHSLGLPTMVLSQTGTQLPFYVLTTRNIIVADFSLDTITNALRGPINRFLDLEDSTDFADNRVTQFYEGLPIVDISAAIGLATGYYYNFVGRLLRDGSFVSTYPDKVKHLIIVRPTNVLDTYEQDKKLLTEVLMQANYVLKTEKLDPPPGDGKGPAWIDHVNGIVIDLPRTIYPLKISPRLLAMQERLDKVGSAPVNTRQRDMLLRQTSERLLDHIEQAIRYHIRKEREGYRSSLLHFAGINEVPALLKQLGV